MNDSVVAIVSNSLRSSFANPSTIIFPLNTRSQQISTVSAKGMLVKRESTSRLAIVRAGSCKRASVANENESFAVYLLLVYSFKMVFRCCESLYVGLLIADRIGRSFGMPLTVGL